MVRDERTALGRQREAELVEQLLGVARHALLVEQAPAHFLVAEKDVGGDGQVRAEHDLLMHRIDAQADRFLRVGERDRLALPVDFAGRALMDGGQDLDERGLAGAVLADDRVNLAFLEGQIDGS